MEEIATLDKDVSGQSWILINSHLAKTRLTLPASALPLRVRDLPDSYADKHLRWHYLFFFGLTQRRRDAKTQRFSGLTQKREDFLMETPSSFFPFFPPLRLRVFA